MSKGKVKEINIALLGLGTVGTGVAKLIKENEKCILEKNNLIINIVKVYERKAERLDRAGLDRDLFCGDPQDIFNDKSVDIVVELLGRIHPSKEYIENALNAKKHVVTANKDLICMHGNELLDVATKNDKVLLYEASCLGAIPAINTIKNNFLGDEILAIKGIFNGTTNFILTKMKDEGMSFDAALKIAQELGYAESDPTNDVDGIDAAYKLCILSRLAFGVDAKFEDISKRGIRSVAAQDIAIAKRLGYTIKLLAIGKMTNGKLEMRVNPIFVPNSHQLANINGAFNAFNVLGNYSDEITLIGRGAGSKPTASSVANDIMNFGYDLSSQKTRQMKKVQIEKDGQMKFCLRLTVFDRPGILSKIAKCCGDNAISIESVLQDKNDNPNSKSLIIVTHTTSFFNMQKALSEIMKTDAVENVDSVIEVLE